jgi:photosystem II stability/assembly factor-like uncharacterized protein
MGTINYTVMQSSKSRVFLIDGRAHPAHAPVYESCLRMTGLTKGYGDIESVECPDPENYGKFIEVAEIKGAAERPTTRLEGRYAMDLKSTLIALAEKGCTFDVQLHMGESTDARLFNKFKKAIVLENVRVTSFDTEDLGALGSDDNAVVGEGVDISAASFYEVLPLAYTRQADSLLTNEALDVAICDSIACGELGTSSDGCQKIFVLTGAAGGSPGTPADIVFSPNRATWYAKDISTLSAAEAPNALTCSGLYLVVVSAATVSLHYAPLVDFTGAIDPTWTEVTTGFVAGGAPRAIFTSGRANFIVGAGGYVYYSEDITSGVSVLDAGSATVDSLNAIHGASEEMVVAVGDNGAVIYTENGVNWTSVAADPVGAGVNLNTVYVKSKYEWWVGASNGRLYYTTDKGASWTEKGFPGSGSGVVQDIVFATGSVGYLSHTTSASRGRILRSFDGGQSWVVEPDSGSLPLADKINALAVCHDANQVVAAGLADDGTDGYVVLGQA